MKKTFLCFIATLLILISGISLVGCDMGTGTPAIPDYNADVQVVEPENIDVENFIAEEDTTYYTSPGFSLWMEVNGAFMEMDYFSLDGDKRVYDNLYFYVDDYFYIVTDDYKDLYASLGDSADLEYAEEEKEQGYDIQINVKKAGIYKLTFDVSEDQLESYKAQVAYYTDAIAKNPRWRFVDIYADEGITGTMAKKRTNFMRMMRDCDKGKIDLILTKSVARFARNTVDSLNYVRKLKAKGIGVYFEEQALDSLKTENEMAIGLYSVLAQAESENISANVRWGIQQRMKSGTFKFRYNLLGYRKGENGEPEIVEEEARYIRDIFNMYLNGCSLDQIKDYLESEGVSTKTGKTVWSKSLLKNILSNERYCGDLLMQKTYTENCITKKVKKNRGEMPKYLVKNNHPAIVTQSTFKMVQMEMARRGNVRKKTDSGITEQGKYSGRFALTDLLVCGECGSPYRRKTYSRNGVNQRVWRCLSRLENGTAFCADSVTIDDEKIKQAVMRGISSAVKDRKDVLDLILSNLAYAVTGQDGALDVYAFEKQLKTLNDIMDETMELAANSSGDGKRFQQEIRSLSEQMVVIREQLEIAKERIASNEKINSEIENIKEYLSSSDICFTEYSDVTVRRLVEYIRVMKDNSIIIVLKGGIQIREPIETNN